MSIFTFLIDLWLFNLNFNWKTFQMSMCDTSHGGRHLIASSLAIGGRNSLGLFYSHPSSTAANQLKWSLVNKVHPNELCVTQWASSIKSIIIWTELLSQATDIRSPVWVKMVTSQQPHEVIEMSHGQRVTWLTQVRGWINFHIISSAIFFLCELLWMFCCGKDPFAFDVTWKLKICSFVTFCLWWRKNSCRLWNVQQSKIELNSMTQMVVFIVCTRVSILPCNGW